MTKANATKSAAAAPAVAASAEASDAASKLDATAAGADATDAAPDTDAQTSGAAIAAAAAPAVAGVKVRVLLDCAFGKADDVIELPADLIEANHGDSVDATPEAVAYAESLKK